MMKRMHYWVFGEKSSSGKKERTKKRTIIRESKKLGRLLQQRPHFVVEVCVV